MNSKFTLILHIDDLLDYILFYFTLSETKDILYYPIRYCHFTYTMLLQGSIPLCIALRNPPLIRFYLITSLIGSIKIVFMFAFLKSQKTYIDCFLLCQISLINCIWVVCSAIQKENNDLLLYVLILYFLIIVNYFQLMQKYWLK